MAKERESRTQDSQPFVEPDEETRARREAKNGLRQFDALMEMIDRGLAADRFRLRPSQMLQLNRIAVEGLIASPGAFRQGPIEISGSKHTPPDAHLVPELVDKMCEYVNDRRGDETALSLFGTREGHTSSASGGAGERWQDHRASTCRRPPPPLLTRGEIGRVAAQMDFWPATAHKHCSAWPRPGGDATQGHLMKADLAELLEILRLEPVEKNIFRGESQDLGWGNIYGGQVLGQALSAVQQTVPKDRIAHSLHAYFLRVGDASLPVDYEVDRIRDGKSFTTRRVVAVQKGRPIFNLAASFQIDELGFSHQDTMPEVRPPEACLSETQLARAVADTIPERMRARAVADKPVEIRPVEIANPMDPQVMVPRRHLWMKAADQLPDDLTVHQLLLAYASDFHLVGTALLPHKVSVMSKDLQAASLDHAMYFHRPFRFDDWLLYAVDSPTASHARGLARGQFFTRGGVLVASTIQEGLVRRRPAPTPIESPQ